MADIIMLVTATALVGRKYLQERRERKEIENNQFTNEILGDDEEHGVETEEEETIETVATETTETTEFIPILETSPLALGSVAPIGISQNTTSGGLPFTPINAGVEVAQKVEVPDTSYFDEQFFPSDTKNTGPSINAKAWMSTVDSVYPKPKTERVAEFPTRDDRADLNNLNLAEKVRDFGNFHTRDTTHITKDRNHERPIEQIATGNGSNMGFHPTNMNRLHKFVLSENELLDLPQGPRGNFLDGALASSNFEATDNNKKERKVDHVGPATAPAFHLPLDSSLQTDPSNAENYNLAKHHDSAARGPVERTSVNSPEGVSVAHDEKISSFKTMLTSGKFKTSGTRKTGVDTTLKNASIKTPSVVGSMGGTRSMAVSKDSQIKTNDHHENLGQAASRVISSVGTSSLVKAFVAKPSHEFTEESVSETKSGDTEMRKRSLFMKAMDTSEEMNLGDKRDIINEKEFTSKNFIAPTDNTVPKHLRGNPTSSLTLSKNEVHLKEDVDREGTFALSGLGRSKLSTVSTGKHTVRREMLASENAKMFSTILNDRMSGMRKPKTGDTRNPYAIQADIVQ